MTTPFFNGLFLIILFTLISGCSSDEEKAQKYLASAKSYFLKKEYSLASIELKNATRKDSSLIEPYLLHAEIFEIQQQWELMNAFLASALQQNAKHPKANLEMAKLYLRGGFHQKAQDYLNIAKNNGVNELDLHTIQASIYLQKKNIGLAFEEIKKALAIDNHSTPAVLLLSSIHLANSDHHKAIKTLDDALLISTNNEQLLSQKAKIFSIQKNYSSAIQVFKDLISTTNQLKYYYLLSAAYHQQGKPDVAEKTLRNAVNNFPTESEPKAYLANYINRNNGSLSAIITLEEFINVDGTDSTDLMFLLADLYVNEENLDKANALYNELAKSDDKSSSYAKSKLAILKLMTDKPQEALSILNEVLSEDFNNNEALISRSVVYSYLNDYDRSITDLLNALRETPDSQLSLYLLADAHLKTNNPDKAAVFLKRLLKINPLHFKALITYNKLLFNNKDYPEIISVSEKYLDSGKSSKIIQEHLIQAYISINDWNNARTMAKHIASSNSQPFYTQHIEALINRLTGNYQASIALSESLINNNVYIKSSLNNIVLINRSLRNNANSQFLKDYINIHPADLYAISLYIDELDLLNKSNEALSFLKSAVEKNPAWKEGQLALANRYSQIKAWNMVIDHALQAYNLSSPKDALASLQLLGYAFEQTGEHSSSIKYYTLAYDINPSNNIIANNLALLLAKDNNRPENLNKAYEIAKSFAQSNNPAYLDTLGWIAYLRGELQQAAALLEKAVFHQADNSIFHYHLGTTLHKLNEMNKATYHLQLAANNLNNTLSTIQLNEINSLLSQIQPAK